MLLTTIDRKREERPMLQPIKVLSIAAVALLAAGLTLATGSPAESADYAKLAGDPGPGPYPQGCVDCHSKDGPESIGALLESVGHRNVDDKTETVPGDCKSCHSEEGGLSLLSELSHIFHYQNPAKNDFIRVYGGECLHCHALDIETGAVTTKSGPKNW
jgi:hypothetical protein